MNIAAPGLKGLFSGSIPIFEWLCILASIQMLEIRIFYLPVTYSAEPEACDPMSPEKPGAGDSSTTDSAKRAGKQAAKKTVGKIAEKLVSWLKKVLWEKPIEYIKLKGKKYLKIAGEKGKQQAELVGESDVPSKYQRKVSDKLEQMMGGSGERSRMSGSSRPRGRTSTKGAGASKGSQVDRDGRPFLDVYPDPRKSSQNGGSTSGSENSQGDPRKPGRAQTNSRPNRDDSPSPETVVDEEMDGDELPDDVKKQLKDAPPEVVAELAAQDQRIRSYVLENPKLVGASNREEAEQRIKLMSGATAESLTQFDTKRGGDVEELLSDLGPKWSARLGYNEMGESLPNALNEASGSSGDGGGESSGDGDSGYSSAMNGGELAGTASGTVDTGSGSMSISSTSGSSGSSGGASNGIGNTGGAGNGLGSGSGNGNGGAG